MSYRNYPKENNIRRKKVKRKKTMPKLPKLPPINKNLLIVVLMLIIFGMVAIFSATAPEGVDYYQNPLYYPIRHLFFAAVGFVAMFITSKIHYKRWQNWVIPIAIFVTAFIMLTLIPGIGKTSYGASRWIIIGSLQIQPSEFAKLACILLMANALSTAKSLLDKFAWKHFAFIAFMLLIIIIQPNMSMVIMLVCTSMAMLFAAGMNKVIFLTCAGMTVPVIAYKIMGTSYQSKRIIGWLHPEMDPQGIGYNIIQSWYAISSGGLLGVGLGGSKQKLYYLPVGYTDFIFSVIAEEMGFVGILVLISLFLMFIHFGLKIATHCDNLFGRLLAFGIVFNIGFQAFTNMCVASGVFPVTGVTLPLISYGGSSFIATCTMIGILFNISRYSVSKERIKGNDSSKTKA